MAKLKIQTIDEQIAELKAKREAELQQEIEQLKLASQVDDARFELGLKLKGEFDTLQKKRIKEDIEFQETIENYHREFETKYGVPYLTEPKKKPLTINEKCKMIAGFRNKDKTPKYKLNEAGTAVVGAKGNELKSTIVFKDEDGDKQTLKADNLLAYLKG
jgi:hypothetical protein